MPDLDILRAGISPRWAVPYRLLAGVGDPQDVAQAIFKVLTASLRQFGGFPRTDDLGDIVKRVTNGKLAPCQAFSELRAVELSAMGHLHTRMAVRAAEQLVVGCFHGQKPPDVVRAITAGACSNMIDYQLFGRARLHLAGTQYESVQQARAFEASCKTALASEIAKIVEQLVGVRPIDKLRAPHVAGHLRRSTADLLYESVTG